MEHPLTLPSPARTEHRDQLVIWRRKVGQAGLAPGQDPLFRALVTLGLRDRIHLNILQTLTRWAGWPGLDGLDRVTHWCGVLVTQVQGGAGGGLPGHLLHRLQGRVQESY